MAEELQPPTEGSPERKQCLVCCEPILPGAKKCISCDSYQDWRRGLGMSSSVLALIVALVSVLSLSVPIVAKLLQKDDSNVIVALQGVQDRNVYFLASNTGSKPGSVGDAALVITHGKGKTALPLFRTDKPPIVEPGASIQLSYTLLRSQRSQLMRLVVGAIELDGVTSNEMPTDASFRVQTIDFSGASKTYVLNMPFNRLMTSMMAYLDPRCEGAQERLKAGPLPQAELSFLRANC